MRPLRPTRRARWARRSRRSRSGAATGLRVIVARPFTHTGPGQPTRLRAARLRGAAAPGTGAGRRGGADRQPGAGARSPRRARRGGGLPALLLGRGGPGEVYNVSRGEGQSVRGRVLPARRAGRGGGGAEARSRADSGPGPPLPRGRFEQAACGDRAGRPRSHWTRCCGDWWMPKRTDLQTILLIGSGPIVIGQGAEFDYSGTQAVRALKEEGYRVVLVNSNPATIMTDPELADRTYIEPVTPEWVAQGDRARAAGRAAAHHGRPDRAQRRDGARSATARSRSYGVELIGANERAIRLAEDREEFADAMRRIGLATPQGRTVAERRGGAGGGRGHRLSRRSSARRSPSAAPAAASPTTVEEFETLIRRGLELSPVGSVLVERSIIGWKEFELEVMRDGADNVVIVCSIENLDPMGVHTGDSITVAPAMTLTDREYQVMRDAAIRDHSRDRRRGGRLQHPVRGGSRHGRAARDRDEPARLALVGARLQGDRLPDRPDRHQGRGGLPARRAAQRHHPDHAGVLRAGARLRGGEDPAVRLREVPDRRPDAHDADEVGGRGDGDRPHVQGGVPEGAARAGDGPARLGHGRSARATTASPTTRSSRRSPRCARPRRSASSRSSARSSSAPRWRRSPSGPRIDPWFLYQMAELVEAEKEWAGKGALGKSEDERQLLRRMKRLGFSDRQLAELRGTNEAEIRVLRHRLGIRPAYKTVDTCAGEFPSSTPYLYSSYDEENEARGVGDRTVVILGSGPNRIGQGVEFDYCCVRAAMALPAAGLPHGHGQLEPGDRLHRLRHLRRALLRAAHPRGRARDRRTWSGRSASSCSSAGRRRSGWRAALEREGVRILGTSPEAIDLAEDRGRFEALTRELGVAQPPSGVAHSVEEAVGVAARVGYPVLVRPSYVLGGRAMEIVYDDASLRSYFERAARVAPEHPVLIDSFLEDAFEADVDAIADGTRCVIGGVMQHIEDAGIHSGDSACVLPPVPHHRGAGAGDAPAHPRLRGAAGRGRAHQRAVRHQERRRLRARGEPARLAHGARSSPRPPACRSPVSRPRSWWARRSTTWGCRTTCSTPTSP